MKSVDLLKKIVDLKEGGEHRKQQEEGVEAIEQAMETHENLLLESPTGSGKTFNNVIPSVNLKKRVVISTATKQLSEQAINKDIPFIRQAITTINKAEGLPAPDFTAELFKGRTEYLCLKKLDDSSKLEEESSQPTLLDIDDEPSEKTATMAKQVQGITRWANKTQTGDRSEAPAVEDKIWKQFSISSSECPGRNNCPFGNMCFSEKVRAKAKKADIVVTNHAVVAQELGMDDLEHTLLGERDVFIFDEMHELVNYLSSAWGTSLTAKTVSDLGKALKKYSGFTDSSLHKFEEASESYEKALANEEPHLVKEEISPMLAKSLSTLYQIVNELIITADEDIKNGELPTATQSVLGSLSKRLGELDRSVELLMDNTVQTVRWFSLTEKTEQMTFNAAPLLVGPKLQEGLSIRDAIMVGTSATIRVMGSFDIPIHTLGLDVSSTPYKTLSLDSPFDYKHQAMLYIPSPQEFPSPDFKNRKEHTEKVKEESLKLIKASEGRALCLSTTADGAKFWAYYLRKNLPEYNVLLQGDKPHSQLVEEFTKDEHSILVATMGMWHGLDLPGTTCQLVIMDKLPFAPANDPLSAARRSYIEDNGGNGFMQVFVADANVKLAQGFGRLIRSKTDRGVVAIFDTRIFTKSYGKAMLKSLPEVGIYQNSQNVQDALGRLATQAKSK